MTKRIQRISDNNFMLLYNKYKLLALNLFEWYGLPDDIKIHHIEKALYSYGACCLTKEYGGYVVLGCTESGELNVMSEPISYIANGYGYTKKVNVKNTPICLNNDLRLSTHIYVQEYARKMNEVEKSINANIKQQKFPWLITTTKNNEFSMKNLYNKIDSGEPIIYGTKDIDSDSIKAFNTNTPYVVDKLNEYRYELEREILTFFGLNNNFEKKERLLVDEVNSNNEFITANIDIMLKCREDFCKEVNEMFGLNISVKKKYGNIEEGGVEDWQDTQLN